MRKKTVDIFYSNVLKFDDHLRVAQRRSHAQTQSMSSGADVDTGERCTGHTATLAPYPTVPRGHQVTLRDYTQ